MIISRSSEVNAIVLEKSPKNALPECLLFLIDIIETGRTPTKGSSVAKSP